MIGHTQNKLVRCRTQGKSLVPSMFPKFQVLSSVFTNPETSSHNQDKIQSPLSLCLQIPTALFSFRRFVPTYMYCTTAIWPNPKASSQCTFECKMTAVAFCTGANPKTSALQCNKIQRIKIAVVLCVLKFQVLSSVFPNPKISALHCSDDQRQIAVAVCIFHVLSPVFLLPFKQSLRPR